MIADYFESLIGTYAPISDGITSFDKIDFTWVVLSLLLITTFHCFMRVLAVILRRLIKQ